MTHTPGPWKPSLDYWNDIYGPKGEAVCTINPWESTPFSDDNAEARANARLIATAPDLLAACKAQERYEQYVKEHGHDNSPVWLALRVEAVDKRKAAIKAAEGGGE